MSLNAQQVPFYNHAFVNPFVFNPAYTGYNEVMNAFLVRNSRNTNFGGGSINNYLTIDAALGQKKYGMGLILNAQNYGIQSQMGGSLSYSYKLKINANHNIRFGLSAGFIDNNLDNTKINVQDVQDPYLEALRNNKLVFNCSAGLVYQYKSTRIGFSVPQLIGNKVVYGGTDNRGFYQLERHYMASVTHPFYLSKDLNWSIVPNVLARFSPRFPVQYDVLVQVNNQKLGWIGVGYKSDYALEFNIGVRFLKMVQIGYSYEMLIGKLNQYQSGMNHEFMLGISIGNLSNKRIQDLEKEAAELERQNALAQDQLRRLLKEQEELKDKMRRDSLAFANRLRDSLDAVNAKNAQLAQQLNNSKTAEPEVKITKTEEEEEESQIVNANGYKFIELDETDSPSGFYVVTGVFSNRSNADSYLEKCIEYGYPDSKLVINQNNDMFYVVILYTLDKASAIRTNIDFRNGYNKKTWILVYQRI